MDADTLWRPSVESITPITGDDFIGPRQKYIHLNLTDKLSGEEMNVVVTPDWTITTSRPRDIIIREITDINESFWARTINPRTIGTVNIHW